MAKRFTDTAKWMDPWFHQLKPIEKLFWFYLVDNCDHAGIWKVNWPLVNTFLGNQIDEMEIMAKMQDRVLIIKEDVWFIPSFIHFQYPGGLKPEKNMAHRGVIKQLKINKINISPFIAPSKGLERGTGIGIGKGIGIGNKGGAGGKKDPLGDSFEEKQRQLEKIRQSYESIKKSN